MPPLPWQTLVHVLTAEEKVLRLPVTDCLASQSSKSFLRYNCWNVRGTELFFFFWEEVEYTEKNKKINFPGSEGRLQENGQEQLHEQG